MPPARLEGVATLVRERVGLVFPENRKPALAEGVARAMRRARADPASYLARLAAEPVLLENLVGELTVGETYFFREPERWHQLRQEVFPALFATPSPRPVRIWSAGCATGEEPYTAAIVLHEMGLLSRAQIIATDLSRPALIRARAGVYNRWSLRGVPDTIRRRCFKAEGERFALEPTIRDAVRFEYLNLVEDSYPSLAAGVWGIDLLLCRNVLIYFDLETISAVARRLLASLSEIGWLVVGAADPLLSERVTCDVVITSAGLVYRRAQATPVADRAAEESAARAPPPVEPARLPVASSLPFAPRPLPPADAPPVVALSELQQAYASAQYSQAVTLARDMVAAGRDEPEVWAVLVRALANAGRLAEAADAVTRALERQRMSPELTYLYAVLLNESNRPLDAAAAARRALYLDPAFVAAHLTLGAALARAGRGTAAVRALRNAHRLLEKLPPDQPVPECDGARPRRLVEMVQAQLTLLGREVA